MRPSLFPEKYTTYVTLPLPRPDLWRQDADGILTVQQLAGLWLSGRASGSHPEGRRFESAQVHLDVGFRSARCHNILCSGLFLADSAALPDAVRMLSECCTPEEARSLSGVVSRQASFCYPCRVSQTSPDWPASGCDSTAGAFFCCQGQCTTGVKMVDGR